MENDPRYYVRLWAAQRSGLRFTCISSKLSVDELAYILDDCGAKAFITTTALMAVAAPVAAQSSCRKLDVLGEASGAFTNFEPERAEYSTKPIPDESAASAMLYSSGTTGRPKGVKRAGVIDPDIAAPNTLSMLGTAHYGWNADSVYLSPAPL